MRIRLQTALVALFIGLLPLPNLLATSVRTVNLAEMVEASNRVFLGRCLAVRQAENKAGFPVVEYTFEVLEDIKGPAKGEVVTFRQVSSATHKRRRGGIPGMPSYKKGQEIVLFLHPDSSIGLTSPVGLAQGIFEIREQEKGDPRVVNALGNRNLAMDLGRDKSLEMGLSAAEYERMDRSEALSLKDLKAAVRKIDDFQTRGRRSLR